MDVVHTTTWPQITLHRWSVWMRYIHWSTTDWGEDTDVIKDRKVGPGGELGERQSTLEGEEHTTEFVEVQNQR